MIKFCVIIIIAFLSACNTNDDENLSKEISQAIKNDQYTPPENNQLTDEQIKNYILIRIQQRNTLHDYLSTYTQKSDSGKKTGKEENNISIQDYIKAFRTLSESREHLSTYITSAKKLGYNSKEYEWVKNTIFATMRAQWADSLSIATIKAYQNTLKDLQEQEKTCSKLQNQHLITQQIRILNESVEYIRHELTPLSETELINIKLLKKYIPHILQLKSEINELHQKLKMVNHE